MALFQRRPQASDPKGFYTLGLHKTLLIVGLGNPGREYDSTRHNVGFVCIDAFAKTHDFSDWILKKDLCCELAQATIQDARVLLMKPTTFMNLSGKAVQATARFYQIPTSQIVVVHDDIDIDFGLIRTRLGGSAAGHNGIKSLIEHMDKEFGRVRIGIGPKKPAAIDSADFVLQKFSKQEAEHLPELTREATAILSECVYSGGQLLTETRSFLV